MDWLRRLKHRNNVSKAYKSQVVPPIGHLFDLLLFLISEEVKSQPDKSLFEK
jgi:hypothetical protein